MLGEEGGGGVEGGNRGTCVETDDVRCCAVHIRFVMGVH